MKVSSPEFTPGALPHVSAPSRSRSRGFTLIETLAVIGLLAVMCSVAAPAVQSLVGSASINRSISDLPLLVELARSEAKARNTHIWIGIKVEEETNFTTSVALFASQDGTADGAAGNTRQIFKTLYFRDIRLTDQFTVNSSDRPSDAFDLSADRRCLFELTEAGSTPKTFQNLIQISPSGEVSLPPTTATEEPIDLGVARWINLNLLPTKGKTSQASNSCQLRIATLTGQVQLIRR